MDFSKRFPLFLIFIIAFSIRLCYSFSENITPCSDARHYDKLALNISIGKGYTEQDKGPVAKDRNVIAWAPLYPFFLASIYKVVGHSYPAVWILQAIMGAGACILIYILAKKAFNQKVAFFSAIITTFCFDLVVYTGMLLTETLYIFLVLVCFLCLFKAFDQRINIKYLAAGTFAGLSALTRPIIMIFFVFLSLWGFKEKGIAKGILFFLLCLFLVISPWIIRNYLIYQQFIPITAAGGGNFWAGNNLQADGEYLLTKEMYNPNLSYLELDYEGYKKGARFIVQNPGRFFVLAVKKMSLFWSLLRTNGWWFHMQGLDKILSMTFSFIFATFIFSFGILGIVFSFKENTIYRFWLRTFIFLCPLSLIPFFVEVRFRLPIYPFMIIFASYGLSLLPQIKSAIRSKETITLKHLKISTILIALLLLNTIYDSIVNLEEIMSRVRLLF